ncbi:5-oxoprolinase subunit PxpB [Nocardioides alkalitolerans]|uniref:5-oxoprolinase subunit PxpB n=1 Tax=Nocardioides alkalitolerans TaxID=281714 RepID=UPI00041C8ADD|nr:5-oxoprolinase subunit PxpB [Nocardioides alkalitolerans]
MTRLLPYGDRAVLVEVADAAEVVAWSDALLAAGLVGHDGPVEDVVPAARTVLVTLRPGHDLDALRSRLARVEPAPVRSDAVADPGDVVEIPVTYDGPDLADVARLTGLDEAAVVEAHTASTWRVAFGGFAPGFGYLVGGDPRLEVPRRDSARTEVPAGSVGLAGEFSGVYPRASPGGWQLIGRTALALWDLDRDPPALLRPGGVVRFVDVGARP